MAVIPDQEPQLAPTANTDHEELQSAMQENIVEQAMGSDPQPDIPIQTSQVKQNAEIRPQDRNFSTRQEMSKGQRGMSPSYTKTSPPPRHMSNRTVDELQSYLMFPKWRSRMG